MNDWINKWIERKNELPLFFDYIIKKDNEKYEFYSYMKLTTYKFSIKVKLSYYIINVDTMFSDEKEISFNSFNNYLRKIKLEKLNENI